MKNNINDGGGMNSTNENNVVQLDREIEERMVREEIRRRQELKDEVRMEMEMGREIMGKYYGVSNVDHAMLMKDGSLGFQYRPNYSDYLLNLGTSDGQIKGDMELVGGPSDGIGVFGNEEKKQMEEVAFGKWPFSLIREPHLVAGHVAEKLNAESAEEVMGEATPTTGIISMKRKAETSARPCDEVTTPNVTQDTQQWFCSLCEVSTTSEVTLHSHFQGKKHKSREARSIPNDTSSTMKMLSDIANNAAPSLRLGSIGVSVSTVSSENDSASKKWECSVCQLSLSSEVLLTSHLQGKKHKAKEAKFQAGEIIAKIEGYPSEQLYCSICQVSASSPINVNDHLKGKKHKAKAGQSQQVIVSMTPEPAEKVPRVEVRKGKSSDSGDLNSQLCKAEETEQEKIVNEHKDSTVNVSKVEVTKVETKLDGNRSPGLGEDSDVNNTGSENQGDLTAELLKYWHCKMCNKGTADEATMAAHRKSNEHMTLLKEHGGSLISVVTISKEALQEGISKAELSA